MDDQFELEKQLHEQYAINNNANTTSIIALITTLLGVVSVYGYIFIHSTIGFASDMGSMAVPCGQYSLDVLLFSAIAAFFILIVIFYLSAFIGSNQRKEQFIAFAIRHKNYKNKSNEYDQIFPSKYHPFNKSKSEFVQGLYGEICCILKILFWLISISTIIKLLSNFYKYYEKATVSYYGLTAIVLFALFFILSIVAHYCIIEKLYISYKSRENEFLNKECGLEFRKKHY